MIRPRSSTPAPKSQWTISAFGSIAPLDVGEQRPSNCIREEGPDRDHDQRRLDQKPPEALAARVQQGNACGLGKSPHDAADRRKWAERHEGARPEARSG